MKNIIIFVLLTFLVSVTMASGKAITYEVDGKSFEGFYVSAYEQAPFILIIHDWDGLTEYEITRANMLVDLGYSVFVADLYGAGIRPTEFEHKRKLTSELYADREKMRTLMYGALEAAKIHGADVQNAVAIGYCFGGAAVLDLARSGIDLKGFVSFHGGLTTPPGQSYSETKGKVLILHGTADKNVTMDHYAKLATELEINNISHEMINYSGAPHAFTVFESDRYRKDADQKSWSRFTDFLLETLEK